MIKKDINYYKKFLLKEKTALVLGGFGLIGQKVTESYLNMGCKVVVLDKKNVKKHRIFKKKFNNKFIFEEINLINFENINEVFSSIKKSYPKLNIFINCSYPKTSDWEKNNFKQIKLKSMRQNIDINLNTSLWILKEVANNMAYNKVNGSIINLSSIYGVLGQDLNIYNGTNMKENFTYSAIKGAIVNATRQMASYYGKYNIRINVICPGGVIDNQNKKFIKNYTKKTPLKRMAFPEDIASSAVFLGSDASNYITGATLMVDGGWSII